MKFFTYLDSKPMTCYTMGSSQGAEKNAFVRTLKRRLVKRAVTLLASLANQLNHLVRCYLWL